MILIIIQIPIKENSEMKKSIMTISTLVEYANAVMAKYEKYLRSKSALDCVKKMYKDLCSYNTKIILCDNQSDLGALYSNIKEYEWIIEHIPSAVSVEALV